MLFHLGALRFLNEAGWLPRLTRVASVSGGSITAGVVGLAWKDLAFNANGVATRFTDLVERPVLLLASSTIDIPAVLTGLWPGRIADRVARAR
jgi:NTE family protein